MTEYLIRYCELIFNSSVDSSDKLMSESLGNVGLATNSGVKGHTLPAQMRPKSLAISTPTKLLSLEEARSKHGGNPQLPSGGGLNASLPVPSASQKFIDVGGGPDKVPTKYHTVIDLPSMTAHTFILYPLFMTYLLFYTAIH